MKYLLNILLIIVSVLLSACESTGWQWQGAPDVFTPGVSADTKVRTWDGDGKPFDCGFTGSYYGWEVCRSHNLDSDPETRQEIRVPLTAICAQHPEKTLSEVSKVLIEPHNKNASPVQVRDIRIEYETPKR